MSPGEALDPAAVAALQRAQDHFGNPGFVGQLARLFLQHAPRRMDEMRGAVAAGDPAALEGAAHTLKTSCAMFGAARLASCCSRIEEAASRGDFSGAAALLAEAESAFPGTLAAVEELGARDEGLGARD